MITEKDLIGTWSIVQTMLNDTSDGKQEEIDKINAKYTLEFRTDGTYEELNNGILRKRLFNFYGKYLLNENDIKLTFRTFNHGRTYTVLSYDDNKGIMTVRPCDSLFCNIYSNIDRIVLQKKV